MSTPKRNKIDRQESGWADNEFAEVSLGDSRLNQRLIKLSHSFSESPEAPINQACENWAETKAAYRFFKNPKVACSAIMATHREQTAKRADSHETILAIQDTSYFVYTSHQKTKGLGDISLKKGKNVDKIYSRGLVMHACMATTTKGLPLGLLSQKIVARKNTRAGEKPGVSDRLPIEEKESYRWLEALKDTKDVAGNSRVVTVCDREADIYDFFKLGKEMETPVLVRASTDRPINRKSRYAEKDVVKLWAHVRKLEPAGTYEVDIPRKSKSKHSPEREARTAKVTVRYGTFRLNPPRNHPKQKTEDLPDLEMTAIHVIEENPPEGEEGIEWMLLTNLPVNSFEEACEKIRWYGLRWRIEVFFKVIKSGFRVEACRLAHGERLARYLTVMSVVAWRIFRMTLLARTDPNECCSQLLTQSEWQILIAKTKEGWNLPVRPPTIKEAVAAIAKLGGHLGRECDGPPGTLTLWRGWKRLINLVAGAKLANLTAATYG
jgi:hypothetical protein